LENLLRSQKLGRPLVPWGFSQLLLLTVVCLHFLILKVPHCYFRSTETICWRNTQKLESSLGWVENCAHFRLNLPCRCWACELRALKWRKRPPPLGAQGKGNRVQAGLELPVAPQLFMQHPCERVHSHTHTQLQMGYSLCLLPSASFWSLCGVSNCTPHLPVLISSSVPWSRKWSCLVHPSA
jgi:hypothetical protein